MKPTCNDGLVAKPIINPKVGRLIHISLNDLKALYYATNKTKKTIETLEKASYLTVLFNYVQSQFNSILALNHCDFWQLFYSNPEASLIINEFLYFFGRLAFITFVEESIEISGDISSQFDTMLTKAFRVMLRLSSPAEDEVFLSTKVYKQIIYQNFLLYSPLIFEVLIVFEPLNHAGTLQIVNNFMMTIPEYFDDVNLGFQHIFAVMYLI